jgi:hypothetical protein
LAFLRPKVRGRLGSFFNLFPHKYLLSLSTSLEDFLQAGSQSKTFPKLGMLGMIEHGQQCE